ncbi:hypothetical protein BDQ17DRAFT_1429972 [Cyathus striatus]|nr:hypothetical protein BDQ17DRAFT_1429972 [Cyathus striatus]
MSGYPFLPCEILEAFVEEIGAQVDVQALKACAQTCQRFLPIARRHLFSSLTFLDDVYSLQKRKNGTKAFNEILTENPIIGSYVRELRCRIHGSDFENEELSQLIGRFNNIKVLHISTSFGFNQKWDKIPAFLQRSLLCLFQQESLEQLNISWFKNIPVGILAGCSNRLLDLQIQNVEITDDQSPLLISHSAKLAPQSLHISEPTQANATIISAFLHSERIDFSLLKRVTIPLSGREEKTSAKELLKLAPVLESLTLSFPGKDLNFVGTSDILKECSLATLSCLTIKGGRTTSANLSLVLRSLCEELELLPRLPIKEFTFTISTGLESGWNPLAANQGEWSTILTPFISTSTFPELRRMKVVFEIGWHVDKTWFQLNMDDLMKRDFEKVLEKRRGLQLVLDIETATKIVIY